ncbi:MAG: shikimate dehydrogenase [Caulobacterales bacterium]
MKPPGGATVVAGVAGAPVRHSLSPLIQNAWLEAAGIDGVFVPFAPPADRFATFAQGLRGGAVRGINVTVPFKEQALAIADGASGRARRAGAANLLLFEPDGRILADNTDGVGLLAALAAQVSGFSAKTGPAVIFGAGGAARGAAAALLDAGAPQLRIVNRTAARARDLAAALGGPIEVFGEGDGAALDGAVLAVNATTVGLGGGGGPPADLRRLSPGAVVMDMVYRPLATEFLLRAGSQGLATADGLEMLIAQARPSFEAFYGVPPPPIDVRGLCLAKLEEPA